MALNVVALWTDLSALLGRPYIVGWSVSGSLFIKIPTYFCVFGKLIPGKSYWVPVRREWLKYLWRYDLRTFRS